MEFNGALSADGNKLYFTVGGPMWSTLAICYSEKKEGKWAKPKLIDFSGQYLDADPFLFSDTELYFISDRPTGSGDEYKRWDYNIWYSTFNTGSWSEPKYLEGQFNQLGMVLYPSLSTNRNLYFTARENNTSAIYVSKWINNQYQKPEQLSFIKSDINYIDAIVSKNEDFIVFSSNQSGGFGGNDLWISFNDSGLWSEPVNLGSNINSSGNDGQPGLSADQKTLFYSYGKSANKPDAFMTYDELYAHLVGTKNGLLNIYRVNFDATQYKH